MKTEFWMGSQASFENYEKAVKLAAVKQSEWEARVSSDKAEKPDFPPLYELIGGVGVIKIEGDLIAGEAGFLRYFGVIGYQDVMNAVVEGLSDKNAKSLMLYSKSGGGSVNGVMGAANLISQVAQLKPMSAYSEFAASAAYWLTSSAGHITTGLTGINGSLGVIRVVTEYTKAYEKEGITKTVLRSGRYKALGNPYEVLTEEAKAEMQEKLDDLYQIFIDAVATNRGTTSIIADQVMGQGREFLGKRGLDVGLVDAIGDFDAALAYAKANRKLATKKATNFGSAATGVIAQAGTVADNAATTNQSGTTMHLTPEQLAAIAAGASVEEVTGKAGTVTADDKPADDKTTAAPAADAAAATTETGNEDTKTDSEVVAFLKTELASAQVESAAAKAQAQELAGKVTALEADLKSATAVVQASVQSMHVALGKKVDVSKLSISELLTEHASAKTAMIENFKSGGVARNTASTQTENAAAAPLISPRDAAAAKTMFNAKR